MVDPVEKDKAGLPLTCRAVSYTTSIHYIICTISRVVVQLLYIWICHAYEAIDCLTHFSGIYNCT